MIPVPSGAAHVLPLTFPAFVPLLDGGPAPVAAAHTLPAVDVSVTSGPLDDLTVDLSNILAADAFEQQASERLLEHESRLQAEALTQTGDAILRHEAALTRQAESHVNGVRAEFNERAARHTAHGEQLEARLADLTARGQEAMIAAATSHTALVQCEAALTLRTADGRHEVEEAARALALHYEGLARHEVNSLRATFSDEFHAALSASQAQSRSELVALTASHHQVHRALEERAVMVETAADNLARREESAIAAASRRLTFAEQRQQQLVQTTELAEQRTAAAVRDSGAADQRSRRGAEEAAAAGQRVQEVMESAIAERRQAQAQISSWAAEFTEQYQSAIRASNDEHATEVLDLQDTVQLYGAEAQDAETQVGLLTRELAMVRGELRDSTSAAHAPGHLADLGAPAQAGYAGTTLETPEGAPRARSPAPVTPVFGGPTRSGLGGSASWAAPPAPAATLGPTSLVPLVRTGLPVRIDHCGEGAPLHALNAAEVRTSVHAASAARSSVAACPWGPMEVAPT